nr:hypothetical protein [Pseudanabaena sp. 'Roaring Creek']
MTSNANLAIDALWHFSVCSHGDISSVALQQTARREGFATLSKFSLSFMAVQSAV